MDNLEVLLHFLVDEIEASCPTPLKTVGPEHDDGGWTLCLDQPLKDPCLVVSIGVGNLPQFDIGMAKDYGCEVHSYDPTISVDSGAVKAIQSAGTSKNHYYHIGLGGMTKSPNYETRTMPEVVESTSEIYNKVVQIAKIDCEGCEWDAFVVPGALDNIHQLVFELHMWDHKGFTIEKAATLFRHLHQLGFRLVHRNFNPWSLQGSGLKPMLDKLAERDGEVVASQYRMTAANMIKWAKIAGYGYPEADYELWKRQVGGPDAFPCCFELTFVRLA